MARICSTTRANARTVATGDAFFAIKGEKFDGHDFVARALAGGAATAVVGRAHIAALGNELMTAVGQVVPALPVALVATVLLDAQDTPLTLFELKGRVFALMSELEARKAYVHIPRHDRDYALEVGLRMLEQRHLVRFENGLYTINPDESVLLHYYANSIAHLDSAWTVETP